MPHIIAGSIEDAAFGLGYVHAQDRFWQMELLRRLGQGRLAELLPPRLIGSGLIDTDRTMRGLGVYRRATESLNALSPAMRAIIDAYAAGVNAWITDDDQQFGLELTLIKLLSGGSYKPEPWRAADSLVWAKLMALGLDGNWRAELLRLRLARKIGTDTVKFLIEPVGDNQDATLTMANEALKRTDLDRLYRETDNIATRKREASNEWVLSGAHSVSDKPLLANDPHLGAGLSRHLVPGAAGRAGLRHPRRHLARLAGRRAGPQRHDRLGLHHHQPRQPGPVHRARRSDRSQPLHHARRAAPVRRARGDDQRALGRADHHARARDAARAGDRRHHPPHRRSHAPRAMFLRCRRRRSTAPTRRPRASAASAWRRTGKSSWALPAASSRRCRTWSTPTPRVTSA